MDGLTALALLLSAFVISFYASSKKVENEASVQIIEQTQSSELPDIDSTQSIAIQWWREVYQSQLDYSQRYYTPSLQLGIGFRHILVPYVAGFVKGFSLKNGTWEWSLNIPEQITTGVHIREELGFIGGEDGLLLAFDNLSGQERWRIEIDSSVMSISSGAERIYAYSRRGHIYSINPENGEIQWNYIGKEPTSSLYGAGKITEQEELIYAGTGNGSILALDKEEGLLRWQRHLGQPSGFSDLDNIIDIDSNILSNGNTLYTAAFGSKLFAINPLNQTNIWQQPIATIYTIQKDSVKDFSAENENIDVIVALTNKSQLKAYKAKSGQLIWENNEARFRGISQLTKYKNYWLGVDKKGFILLFNRQDGKLANHYKSQASIAMNPAIKDDRFYWLDKKGQLFSMFLQNREDTDFVFQPTTTE